MTSILTLQLLHSDSQNLLDFPLIFISLRTEPKNYSIPH